MAASAPVTAPKESAPEQERRGRLLAAIYATVVLIATAGFVGLAVFVNQQDVITGFDAPVAQAIQSINVPVLDWILLHVSDLGWAPLDVVCVVAIAGALAALRLRLEAVVVVASTLLVWAGPAQVILISALGAGATSVETALAVGLSSVRLLPMVISLLPLIKDARTQSRELVR